MSRLSCSVLAVACALGVSGVAAQTVPGHSMVAPAELKWVDLPSLPPGAKMALLEGPMNEAMPFTARLRFPAHYRIPAHWHPAIEHVSVLSGTFYMGVGETLDTAGGMAVPTGGFAVMQARQPHFAYTTTEPVEVQLHGVGPWGITYLRPEDDPRKKSQP
ncbi:MAG TPA: cupin domain-containing protein [Albitalea sp.]|uniref:cupin domain-containing protein n=1 Tax=Piscinibacter sp. TaxID=1903157 RepID=UPI002ED20333